MLATTRGPVRSSAGQIVAQPGGDARALQADGVEHPGGRRVQPRRRVAGPLERGQRLDDDRAERGQVDVGRPARCRSPAVPDAVITGFGSATEPICTGWARARGRPAPTCSPHGAWCSCSERTVERLAALLGEALHGGERGLDGGDQATVRSPPCGSARRRCARPDPAGC